MGGHLDYFLLNFTDSELFMRDVQLLIKVINTTKVGFYDKAEYKSARKFNFHSSSSALVDIYHKVYK